MFVKRKISLSPNHRLVEKYPALADIPDPQTEEFDAIMEWVEDKVDLIRGTKFTSEILESFAPFELQDELKHTCGPEAFSVWRRFFLATLLADWACYEKPVDRIDYARLKYIMTSAYRHVRLWTCRLPDGQIAPIGYTAWYPIAKFVYDGVLNDQSEINDRGIFMPLRFSELENIHYAYALNISVVKLLRNTPYSRRIIKAYQRDAMRLGNVGIMTITVDEPGMKLSRMAKFAHYADVVVQGESESLFVRKPGWHRGSF